MTAARAAEAIAPPPPPSSSDSGGQRSRILETALALMGEQGAQMTSMRQLAAACELNVATLYHYFPSKAAILQAVIADKRYVEQLQESSFPVDGTLAARDRLAELMRCVFEGTLAEEATLRLVLGESLRSEQVALDAVGDLSDALAATLRAWLEGNFPELETDPAVVARVLRDEILSFCVEALASPDARRRARLEQRATDIAAVVFPATHP